MVQKLQGGLSPTMISEWGVTPPSTQGGSNKKSLFFHDPQQQQQQQHKLGSLLDLSATAAGKKGVFFLCVFIVRLLK